MMKMRMKEEGMQKNVFMCVCVFVRTSMKGMKWFFVLNYVDKKKLFHDFNQKKLEQNV